MYRIVKLVCIDIAMEVFLLSLPALPHEVQMYVAHGLHCNLCFVIDPTYPNINDEKFPEMHWKEFHQMPLSIWANQ